MPKLLSLSLGAVNWSPKLEAIQCRATHQWFFLSSLSSFLLLQLLPSTQFSRSHSPCTQYLACSPRADRDMRMHSPGITIMHRILFTILAQTRPSTRVESSYRQEASVEKTLFWHTPWRPTSPLHIYHAVQSLNHCPLAFARTCDVDALICIRTRQWSSTSEPWLSCGTCARWHCLGRSCICRYWKAPTSHHQLTCTEGGAFCFCKWPASTFSFEKFWGNSFERERMERDLCRWYSRR